MMNLTSYAAGMAFHAGLASAAGMLAAVLLGAEPAPFWGLLARVLTLAGMVGGLALFAKRVLAPRLRGLSCPDDFVANLLSTLFVLLACCRTFGPVFEGIWLVEAMALLVYLPLGKIRHCLFFFTTRRHLGAFFGRRGTFPPGGSSHA
jgi:nitrate reductase gamma subunit